jgi:uncharacterized NAD(P)/FAD-binding protein YdhS
MQGNYINKNETAVFIGFGLSGLVQFCEYVNASIRNKQKSRIVIFEKNADQFATGEPYRLDTPKVWLLNGPAAEAFSAPNHEETLHDWIMQHYQYCHDKYGDFLDRYPPRALIGEYLLSRYEKYKKLALANGMEIEVYHEEVNHLNVTPQQQFLLTSDSLKITADFVGLGVGNLRPDTFHEMIGKPGFVYNPWNTNELDRIPQDEKEIIVIGGHLTFVDTAKYLMLDRQYQGNIFVATRHPNVIAARDFKRNVNNLPMLDLRKKFNDHHHNLSLKVAFTLFNQVYLNTAKHPVTHAPSTQYALTTQLAARDQLGQGELENGDIDELCDFIHVFADTGTYYAMWDALDAEGQEEFSNTCFGRFLAYLAGVPINNARFLKEIYDSGRVLEKSGMTGLHYDHKNNEYVCSFNDGTEKRARYVVNATGIGRRIDRHLDEQPLLADLLQKEMITITDNGGMIVNEHNHVIAKNQQTIANLAAVGPAVYKGKPHGEGVNFIAERAENAVSEHFRNLHKMV